MALSPFESYHAKYVEHRIYFNGAWKPLNITDNIEKFETRPTNVKTLAMVTLMLVHNRYKKVSPNIDDIDEYDTLEKLSSIDMKMFEPYIKKLRNENNNDIIIINKVIYHYFHFQLLLMLWPKYLQINKY